MDKSANKKVFNKHVWIKKVNIYKRLNKQFTEKRESVDFFFYMCLFCVKNGLKKLWIIVVDNFFHKKITQQKIMLWISFKRVNIILY